MTTLLYTRCLTSNKKLLLTRCVWKLARNLSMIKSTNQLDWNRVVSDAERVVGYPTSYLSLRCLLSDEISNLAAHVRKLIGTGHPLLKTAKRLIYNGKTYMHTRGLVVLLISKTAGHKTESLNDPLTDGISHRQRALAEITEMIHMAHQIHKGVVNVSPLLFPDKNALQDMEFGNKIAVLCGDYLLASASKTLATLRHPDVVELITEATRNFTQGEFVGSHDVHGNSVTDSAMTVDDWQDKNYLLTASLLALSCKAALALAGHDGKQQQEAFNFGKNIALAWQVHADLQPFTDTHKHPPGMPFDLTSLPIIIHTKSDPDLIEYIAKHKENLDTIDYKLIRESVLSGSGIMKTKELCRSYGEKSLDYLNSFKPSDANYALRNIVDVLGINELNS